MKGRLCNYYFKHQAKNGLLSVVLGQNHDGGYLKIMTPEMTYRRALSGLRLGRTVSGEGFSFADGRMMLSLPELYGTVVFEGSDESLSAECGRREIIILDSRLSGRLTLVGIPYDLTGGRGYIECERFSPKPARYIWIHASDRTNGICVVLSLEEYHSFFGRSKKCYAVVRWRGGEVCMSTENGAQNNGSCERFSLRQGDTELEAEVFGGEVHFDSFARSSGPNGLCRVGAPASVKIRLTRDNVCLFDELFVYASVEYFEGEG